MTKKMMKARPQPCKSCPYRRDVPSAVWSADEYDKLPRYDGDTASQDPTPFGCHQADGYLCSGWLGHTDPSDLLAVRLGVISGEIDLNVVDYQTDVPLFASGAEAAEHGKHHITNPSDDAIVMVTYLVEVRARRVKTPDADEEE